MATTKNEALKSSLNSHEAGQDNLNGWMLTRRNVPSKRTDETTS